MTALLAEFQSALPLALKGHDACPIDPASAGFRFTTTVRRSWSEGRTMIAARRVLMLLPDAERCRLVAEYAESASGLGMLPPTENTAFLEFLAPRLPDPSHALSLCRMGQALNRARPGSDKPDAPQRATTRSGMERAILDSIEREAWGCIERSLVGWSVPADRRCIEDPAERAVATTVWDRVDHGTWGSAEPGVGECAERAIWERIEHEAWGCIERTVRGRIERASHATLVWFHADPEAVLRGLYGAPPPPLGEPAWPVLIAPGLPNLYRAATAAEADFWARLPADDAPPELLDQLLAEGVVAYTE